MKLKIVYDDGSYVVVDINEVELFRSRNDETARLYAQAYESGYEQGSIDTKDAEERKQHGVSSKY
jgi:hypothetical protein